MNLRSFSPKFAIWPPFPTIRHKRVCTLCPRQILLFVVGASLSWESEIFRKFLKFVRVFGLKIFFSEILYLGGSGPFAPTFRFIDLPIEYSSEAITELQHISLLFSKYWSKTTRRQNLQNKDSRTNWGPELFAIYWPESLIIFCLIIYQILLT